jgi:hypothetical protein
MLHLADGVERVGDGGVDTAAADDGVGQIILRSEQIVTASTTGWLAFFAAMDNSASSALTQQRLGWHPTQTPGLIADLAG